MTHDDARTILGLNPDEDPALHLAELQQARQSIAELVSTTKDANLSARFQKGLEEFDQALATLFDPSEPSKQAGKNQEAIEASSPETLAEKDAQVDKKRGKKSIWIWAAVILTAVAGLLFYYEQDQREEKLTSRIVLLENQGFELIENRRWPEATAAFEEIEKLRPGTSIAKQGRLNIQAGIAEEQTQFIGYWSGQAIAELEANRLKEAVLAVDEVLKKYPDHGEALAIKTRITQARQQLTQAENLAEANKLLDQRQWQPAIDVANILLQSNEKHPEALAIIERAKAAQQQEADNRIKASELLAKAKQADQGVFDPQVFAWLQEANSLDPESKEISGLLEKLASYTRTLRVPEDFPSAEAALSNARDRDRIILGAGTWQGPLVVNAAVDLQGAGPIQTIVQCEPTIGSAISIGPKAIGARISGITFRHTAFAVGENRFSTAIVRGGRVDFVDCRFQEASGHGLVVIEGGKVMASRCRFSGNGWNGASGIGAGSLLEIHDSEMISNFEHGVETWQGAEAIVINSRCAENSRNGIHLDNGKANARIEGNHLESNREFGMVVGSLGSGTIQSNKASKNMLGGFVIKAAALALEFHANEASNNSGPGLVLEKGVNAKSFLDNRMLGNASEQTLQDVEFDAVQAVEVDEEVPPAAIIIEEP